MLRLEEWFVFGVVVVVVVLKLFFGCYLLVWLEIWWDRYRLGKYVKEFGGFLFEIFMFVLKFGGWEYKREYI